MQEVGGSIPPGSTNHSLIELVTQQQSNHKQIDGHVERGIHHRCPKWLPRSAKIKRLQLRGNAGRVYRERESRLNNRSHLHAQNRKKAKSDFPSSAILEKVTILRKATKQNGDFQEYAKCSNYLRGSIFVRPLNEQLIHPHVHRF